MKFELTELPFERCSLEPFISRRTIDFHYDKHHAGYLKKLDKALQDERRDMTLDEVIKMTDGSLFNLAAQVWNHDFYWKSLSGTKQDPEDDKLIALLDAAFGGIEGFTDKFSSAAKGQFGSGWAWLLLNDDGTELSIESTSDAENPLTNNMTPLLTLDVWEHAYYLDYQNRRGDYVKKFLDAHVNWRFVEENLRTALSQKDGHRSKGH